MEVQYMTHVPAVGAAWAFQGRKNKNHIKDWIFPLLSCHHLFSPIIGHSPFARAGRKCPYMYKSFCLFRAHKVRLDVLPWPAILFCLGKETPSSFLRLEQDQAQRPVGGLMVILTLSYSPCTEGQNVGYPCLPCCPLPGLLNLPPCGSI